MCAAVNQSEIGIHIRGILILVSRKIIIELINESNGITILNVLIIVYDETR